MVLDTIEVDGKRLEIQGECAMPFETVVAMFIENFRERRELGASYCIYREGHKVVDVWAGHRDPDRTQDWTGDTLVGMASVIKGMLAMALHMLVDEGQDLLRRTGRHLLARVRAKRQRENFGTPGHQPPRGYSLL